MKLVADFEDGDTRTIDRDGKKEDAVVSKVFPTTHFGFRKITVERPLRLNFNRYFYRYTPPRPLEEIEADIRGIETDIMRMLSDVTGGVPAPEPRQG